MSLDPTLIVEVSWERVHSCNGSVPFSSSDFFNVCLPRGVGVAQDVTEVFTVLLNRGLRTTRTTNCKVRRRGDSRSFQRPGEESSDPTSPLRLLKVKSFCVSFPSLGSVVCRGLWVSGCFVTVRTKSDTQKLLPGDPRVSGSLT